MARDRQCVPQLVSVAVCLWIFIQSVMADYVIEIRVMSYSNPTNECAECPYMSGVRCCDSSDSTVCTGGFQPCDNQFYYCLRPPNTLPVLNAGGCIGYNHTVNSSVNKNDFSINFTEPTVLGLPNPMNLSGLDTFWQGVQLFIEVIDIDSNPKNADDFVDSFSINMLENTTKGSYLTLRNKSGTYNLTTISLTARFLCAENYIGEFCETYDYCSARQINCKGHEVCINEVNGHTCDCEPGYTGTHCETDINECMLTESECSGRGRCTDGVNSFTCVCEQGFTGLLCETNIDDCDGVNCSGHGGVGGSSGVIIGGVVGGLVAVILTVLLLILLVVLVMVVVRTRQVQVTQGIIVTPPPPYTPGDNPVYGAQDTVIIKTSDKSNTAKFDNPVYDIEEPEYETPITTRQPTTYETIPPLYSTVTDEHTEQSTHKDVSDIDSNTVEFNNPIYGDNDIEGPDYATPNTTRQPTVTDDVWTRPQT